MADVVLPHWHFSPNAVRFEDIDRLGRGDGLIALACRRAMESEEFKELVILEGLGVRFTPLVGELAGRAAGRVLAVIPGGRVYDVPRGMLRHMVKTRDSDCYRESDRGSRVEADAERQERGGFLDRRDAARVRQEFEPVDGWRSAVHALHRVG